MAIVCAILLVIVVIVIALFFRARTRTQRFVVRGMIVNVASSYEDKNSAIALMLECNARMMALMRHLRAKYYIGTTDAECGRECMAQQNASAQRDSVDHLLRGFNYEEVHENLPSDPSSTAYSLDKGRKIMLCLREVRAPHNMIDINTLMFVILHEAAHIANWEEWGHGANFWSTFKFLLTEAARIGIYAPINYARAPRDYCGFRLDHNPLFDARIRILGEN